MSNKPRRTVEARPQFKRNLKRLARRYRNIKSDVSPLIEQLQNGDTPGDQVSGTGYVVFKARVANRDAQRGKSGGYRVIYELRNQQVVLLHIIYAKSDQADIAPEEIASIIQLYD